MLTLTIEQVLQLTPGTAIEAVKGKVKAIYDRSAGEKDGEPWSMQPFTITDGTHELRVKVWDREAIPSAWKGKVVYVCATLGNNNKMNGLKVKENTYKGKTTLELNATGAAEISLTDPALAASGESEPAESAAVTKGRETAEAQLAAAAQRKAQQTAPANGTATQAPAQTASAPAAAQPARSHEDKKVDALIDFKRYIGKRGLALHMCCNQLLETYESFALQHGLPWDDNVKKITAGCIADNTLLTGALFVGAEKAFAIDDMPSDDLEKWIEKAKARKQQRLSAAEEQKRQAEDAKRQKAEKLRAELAALEGNHPATT